MDIVESYNDKIHLVVTDVVMPGMKVNEMVNKLLFQDPDLKFIYISGYSEDIVSKHGDFDSNMNFIQKPFSISELAAKVRMVLN